MPDYKTYEEKQSIMERIGALELCKFLASPLNISVSLCIFESFKYKLKQAIGPILVAC